MIRLKVVSGIAFALALAMAINAQSAEAGCCTGKHGASDAQAPSCCSKDAAADAHANHGAGATAEDAHAAHGSHAAQAGQGRGHGGHGGELAPRTVMPDAMRLLHNHASLTRTTEEIPNGVRTVTTTSDPAVLELLRRHPRDMYNFYESGGAVRPHDPMFRELSRVADKVTMEFKDIENGIEATATSDDPEVVKLIRAHAKKVDDFVKRGMSALHEGAPLPDDYHPAE